MDPNFSQRIGVDPIEKEIQTERMDRELTNSLWNVLDEYYFEPLSNTYEDVTNHFFGKVLNDVWANFFKSPKDLIRKVMVSKVIKLIRDRYFTKLEWNKKYELLEYFVKNHKPISTTKEALINSFNHILERENSGYQFINDVIAPIIGKEEIKEIQVASHTAISAVNVHIDTALSELSKKDNPNPRNSIKESISAVEAVCKVITGNSDATMNQALDEIERKGTIVLHGDMKDAFKKLYHYTSDADGIRHSLMEGKISPDSADARFMLVSCSAIVNYLISKAVKAGINLK